MSKLVPGAGVEPARSYLRGILSPLCLPISPPGQEPPSRSGAQGGSRTLTPLGHWNLNPACLPVPSVQRTMELRNDVAVKGSKSTVLIVWHIMSGDLYRHFCNAVRFITDPL